MGEVQVKDLGTAAYLKLRGFSLERVFFSPRDGHVYFVFRGDRSALEQEISNYLLSKGESAVVAKKLVDELLNLRSLVINLARIQEQKQTAGLFD